VTTSGVFPPAQPTAPRRFGQYLLIRKLAEGGMAEIFLAKQLGAEGFERDVVIKCMLDHFSRHQDFIAMFLDEARLAARLHHPNIVQITDLGVADGRYFICMEYLAGEDLEMVVARAGQQRQPVPIPIAARIMLSVLEGLEFAHGYQEQGRLVELVHRDISPSNILVTFQGTVKVLDFGIAKASSRVTQTQPGLLKGKWGYMSPEQARGEPIDGRSDLFSLGITFHELLTGRRVFERDHEIGVLLALMAQPIPPPSSTRPEIPEALEHIIMKALERERDNRYASASAMRADLEEFLRSTPSIPGTTQLAQYMQGLFGQAEVERKTKIPSLTELNALGVVEPQPSESIGYEKTLVRPSNPGQSIPAVGPGARTTELFFGSAPDPASQALPAPATAAAASAPAPVAAPTSAQAPVSTRSKGIIVALLSLAAVGLISVGGGVVWYLSRPPPPPPVVVVPPAVEPEPIAEAEPVAPPEVPTPPVEEPQPTPTPTPTPPEDTTPEPVVKPKPTPAAITLNANSVRTALSKASKKILSCGDQFRSELPLDRRVMLQLTIKNSGEVREAKVTEPATVAPGLAKCLESRAKAMRFPLNKNEPEFAIIVPMKFNETN
jgi:serine/threonine protein kinase